MMYRASGIKMVQSRSVQGLVGACASQLWQLVRLLQVRSGLDSGPSQGAPESRHTSALQLHRAEVEAADGAWRT